MNYSSPRLLDEEKPIPRYWWFKVFGEINTEPRFVLMSNEFLGIYVRLLAVASSRHNHGWVPGTPDEIAVMLRLAPKKLASAIAYYVDKELVTVSAEGVHFIDQDHFDGAGLTWSDSPEGRRERKRRQREKERATEAGLAVVPSPHDFGCHGDASPSKEDESRVENSSQDEEQPAYQGERDTEGYSPGGHGPGGMYDEDGELELL